MGQFLLLFLVFFPILSAFLCYLLGRRDKGKRDIFAVAVTAVELAAALLLLFFQGSDGEFAGFCGLGLSFTASGFRTLMAVIAAFLWLNTTLPAKEYFSHYTNRNRYYFFLLMTLGALMGVFLSKDLYTTFIFFEIMSFTSYVWVVQNETAEAKAASNTYLAIAVIGGLVLLMGLFLLWQLTGTLEIDALSGLIHSVPAEKKGLLYAAGGCMLFGFGAKAGMFPVHIWLPKAHPVAPAPASALLSGILTKSGIYGILAVSCNIFLHDSNWGAVILTLGVITMVLGAVLAVFSIDLKRTLACSSMSQIGFILVGVGMQCFLGEENALAAAGTVLHMMNHSLIKLVLFVAAGVVYMNTHSLNLNEIRGYGKDKPFLKTVFLIGALGIGGIPLFNGYVSKTLLHEGIVEYIELLVEEGASAGIFHLVEWLFLISGGLTVAYMTKIFIAVFVDPKAKGQHSREGNYMKLPTRIALAVGSILMVLFGMLPNLTMDRIASFAVEFMNASSPAHAVHYFSLTNLKGGLISIGIGALVYLFVIRTLLMGKDEEGNPVYKNCWPQKLDLETAVYRPLLNALAFLGALVSRILASVGDFLAYGVFGKLLFYHAPQVVEPGTDEFFGAYGKQDRLHHYITSSLSYDLMLFGLGALATLIYLLLQ